MHGPLPTYIKPTLAQCDMHHTHCVPYIDTEATKLEHNPNPQPSTVCERHYLQADGAHMTFLPETHALMHLEHTARNFHSKVQLATHVFNNLTLEHAGPQHAWLKHTLLHTPTPTHPPVSSPALHTTQTQHHALLCMQHTAHTQISTTQNTHTDVYMSIFTDT